MTIFEAVLVVLSAFSDLMTDDVSHEKMSK
jgi:hypothetical protein